MSGLIYKKMSEVMANIGSVSKDQKNQAQGFKFRGIDQFVNALHPALTKAGVFITPRVVTSSNEVREVERSSGKKGYDKTVNLMVEYDFYAEDGSKVTIGPIASEGLDSGDKATTKALSAALKYALIQTFSVPTEDMVDADSSSPEITSPVVSTSKFTTTNKAVSPNVTVVTVNPPQTVTVDKPESVTMNSKSLKVPTPFKAKAKGVSNDSAGI